MRSSLPPWTDFVVVEGVEDVTRDSRRREVEVFAEPGDLTCYTQTARDVRIAGQIRAVARPQRHATPGQSRGRVRSVSNAEPGCQ